MSDREGPPFTERGVSEVVGFVLVFSIVTMTIGIVYATGLPGLQDASRAEQVENMERAFDVLADNMVDVHRRGAPSRATELKLSGGTVGVGDPVTITVEAVNASDPADNASYVLRTEPIIYEGPEGTRIVYTSGAVIREESSGSVVLAEPGWFNDSRRTVVPYVLTYGAGNGSSIAGHTTLLVVTERQSDTLRGSFSVDGDARARVNITIDSPRADAWGRFLADRGYDPIDADASDGTVTYQFNTTTLYVPQTGIEVSLLR